MAGWSTSPVPPWPPHGRAPRGTYLKSPHGVSHKGAPSAQLPPFAAWATRLGVAASRSAASREPQIGDGSGRFDAPVSTHNARSITRPTQVARPHRALSTPHSAPNPSL